jgi:kinesin family member 5
MNGYNGTIMAYGQTGSGKTFTIFGKKTSMDYQDQITPEMGIIPRSIKQIFSTINENSSKVQYQIRVSFMQVYMEQITDLIQEEGDENNIISPSSPNPNPMVFTSSNKKVGYNIKDGLQIREDPKSGIFVKGLKQVVRKF